MLYRLVIVIKFICRQPSVHKPCSSSIVCSFIYHISFDSTMCKMFFASNVGSQYSTSLFLIRIILGHPPIMSEDQLPNIVAYISYSAGRTHFARINTSNEDNLQ